jgi:tetratricopeptide (TPR) repeat protein
MLRLPLSLLLCLVLNAGSLPFVSSVEPLIDAGHYKRARGVLDARLHENPNDANALYFASKAKESFGDLRGATAAAEKAVALDPRSADYHAQLAECYAYSAEKASWVRGLSLVHQMKEQISIALSLQPHHTDTLLVAMMFYFRAPRLAGGIAKKRMRSPMKLCNTIRVGAIWRKPAWPRKQPAMRRSKTLLSKPCALIPLTTAPCMNWLAFTAVSPKRRTWKKRSALAACC